MDGGTSPSLVTFTTEERADRAIIRARFSQNPAADRFSQILHAEHPELHPQPWICIGVVLFDDPGPEMKEQIQNLGWATAEQFPPLKQRYPPSVFTI